MKKKPIKLNALQSRTLALFQLLAQSEENATFDKNSGEISIRYLPQPHGDHVHVGDYVISAKDASGFSNETVWRALERKGLARSNFPLEIILTPEGQAHDTGLSENFQKSDH